MNKENLPVFFAKKYPHPSANDRIMCKFWCPCCKVYHVHGGDIAGVRFSQCHRSDSPFYGKEYIVIPFEPDSKNSAQDLISKFNSENLDIRIEVLNNGTVYAE